MDAKLNSTVDFEFADGTKTKLTLTFHGLVLLKSKDPTLYGRYNKILNAMNKGDGDELDTITILYTAYMCNRLVDEYFSKEPLNDEPLTEINFIIKCGSERERVVEVVTKLLKPKN